MATANQVLEASLKRIIAAGNEVEIEAPDGKDFYFAMNAFMFALAADGVNLGYTEITSGDDVVTVPLGALRGLITNMAVEVSPDYGAVVSPDLARVARVSMGTMTRLGMTISSTQFPPTLPRGSGNEQRITQGHFYDYNESDILSETTGPIGLEVDTVEAT